MRARAVLPNLITGLRLACVPAVVWLILAGSLAPAFWLFVLAAASDAIDGALARLLHAQTELGSYLDALADKVLLVCIYLCLGWVGLIGVWLVGLVVARDVLLILTAAFLHLGGRQNGVSPLVLSKINTLAQILLAGVVLGHQGMDLFPGWLQPPLAAVVGVTTAGSGLAYLLSWSRLSKGTDADRE